MASVCIVACVASVDVGISVCTCMYVASARAGVYEYACMHEHVPLNMHVSHANIHTYAPAQAYLWYSRPPWAELPTLREMLTAAEPVSVSS